MKQILHDENLSNFKKEAFADRRNTVSEMITFEDVTKS